MTATVAAPAAYGDAAWMTTIAVPRYQQMIAAGVLTGDDKVELLENYVVRKMPHNPLHDGTLDLVVGVLGIIPFSGWFARVQQAIALADSQPEPDIALVRGNRRSYLTSHPTTVDIGLVIEIADSSLPRDQLDKTRIYARAGIVCYWIVNLIDHRIEVYTQPSGSTAVPDYGSMQSYQPGEQVPLVLDGDTIATIAAADLLP